MWFTPLHPRLPQQLLANGGWGVLATEKWRQGLRSPMQSFDFGARQATLEHGIQEPIALHQRL